MNRFQPNRELEHAICEWEAYHKETEICLRKIVTTLRKTKKRNNVRKIICISSVLVGVGVATVGGALAPITGGWSLYALVLGAAIGAGGVFVSDFRVNALEYSKHALNAEIKVLKWIEIIVDKNATTTWEHNSRYSTFVNRVPSLIAETYALQGIITKISDILDINKFTPTAISKRNEYANIVEDFLEKTIFVC